jgi:hypothetical protein
MSKVTKKQRGFRKPLVKRVFHCHTTGPGVDGNCVPSKSDPGWFVLAGRDEDDALKHAPDSFKKLVADSIEADIERLEGCGQCDKPGCRLLSHFLADSAGMNPGAPSFIDDEEWRYLGKE